MHATAFADQLSTLRKIKSFLSPRHEKHTKCRDESPIGRSESARVLYSVVCVT